MNCVAKKSLLLLSLLLLGSCQAQPVKDQQQPTREQRQLKSSAAAAAEADVKMLASNVTPATLPMGGMSMAGLPMNQMALGTVNMQLARYPGYPGMMFGAGASPFLGVTGLAGVPGVPGLPTNIPNGYPADSNMGLGLGLSGLGLGGYPGGAAGAGFMYGNSLYPNAQLGNGGFGAPPTLDNFGPLGNINVQGLGGVGGAPTGLYGQVGVPIGLPMPGYFGGGAADAGNSLLERMSMRNYAPGF